MIPHLQLQPLILRLRQVAFLAGYFLLNAADYLGGIIILSTAGDDHSFTNCVCGVVTVALMHRLVAWLKSKSPRFGALVDGTPLVVLKDGQWQTEAMERAHLDEQDVMGAARTKGVRTLDQIKYAILERNGAISIIKAEQ